MREIRTSGSVGALGEQSPGATRPSVANAPSEDSDAEERPSRAARRADAFAVLAESFLKHGGQALSGGERHQIVVHVDADTLRGSPAGRCEIEQGRCARAGAG